jgi:hypothetical protein
MGGFGVDWLSRCRDGFVLIGFLAPEGELLSLFGLGNCSTRCSTSCIHAVEKKVTKEKATRLPL